MDEDQEEKEVEEEEGDEEEKEKEEEDGQSGWKRLVVLRKDARAVPTADHLRSLPPAASWTDHPAPSYQGHPALSYQGG